MGGKQAGSSKFLQSAKGTMGIVEAIEAGLSAKVSSGPYRDVTGADHAARVREDAGRARGRRLPPAPSRSDRVSRR